MFRHCFSIGICLALVWSFGCGSEQKAAAPVAKVNGTVTMDGKPVPTGEIHFELAGASKVLVIKDGAYSGEAPVGDDLVGVFIYAEDAPNPKYGGEKTKKNTTPERYFGPRTTLKAKVSASGPNEFKYELQSK